MSSVLKEVANNNSLKLRRLAGRIGAEVQDLKLGTDLKAEDIGALKAALRQHRVIFLRDQHQLDDAAQEGFARLFGELVPHPTEKVRAGSTAILELDAASGNGKADQWHTDVTFVDAYPKYSILRAVEIPAFGGDTVWANTAAGYEDLSPQLKQLAENLWAVHSNKYDCAAQRPRANDAERKHYQDVFASTQYETEHPVVRIHPDTGEKVLVLGYFIQRFVGHSNTDSAHLFSLLQDHVIRLENTVRWSWRKGDVAIWDNQSTQHYALNDYGDQNRIVRRSTIAGEVPVSVDGRRSVTRIIGGPSRQAAE
ncbi:TauD/TfdA dioxygenase family protein [Dongia sp.]|uniref:TauD/TfdA dioxygenase family protein n=1 Tax=Dongia sp. TaxID=1977262 RepID=UPI0035B23BC0